MKTNKRIDVLDILRGIAIFGMIIAHASKFSTDPVSNADNLVSEIVSLFIDGRFYTIFAILFGASFAIQFMRVEARGEIFAPRFLRRLLALFCFGILAELFFGFSVLAEYALAGVLLLLVRRWSTKKLILLFIICVVAQRITTLAYSYAYVTNNGAKQYTSKLIHRGKAIREAWQLEEEATTYSKAISARYQQIKWRYSDPITLVFGWMFINLAYFMLGFLCIRSGVFQNLKKHRRLILIMMGVGLLLWGISNWVIPLIFPPGVSYFYPKVSFIKAFTRSAGDGFSLIRGDWLAITYIGAVLLLVSYSSSWLKRFAFFRWTGRMALTNYMLQALMFSILFNKYAIGLSKITKPYILLLSLLIFAILILFSRWWLTRYQYGPLEWLWRSITYWKWQPMKNKETIQIAEGLIHTKN